MNKYVNEMEDYLYNHNYISRNKNKDPLRQQELSIERASCIVQKYRTLIEKKDKEIERLNNIINELEKWYKKQYEDTNKCLDYAREHHNLQEVEKYTRDHNMFAMCMEELDKLKVLKEGK